MPRSLLLVEDNEDDVFFFQMALRKLALPHPLVVARDGREAMACLVDFMAGRPGEAPLGLVLLDLKLPYVGGLEVLAWMRTLPGGRFPPVVVLSASEQESDIQAAYRLGAASFLVKPNRPDQLTELLRMLNTYWLTENRLPAPPPLLLPEPAASDRGGYRAPSNSGRTEVAV